MPFSESRHVFTSLEGELTMNLVPTTLMEPSGLRWRLAWPGQYGPIDIQLGAGPPITLLDAMGTIVTGANLPAGGTTNQILAKRTDDDL